MPNSDFVSPARCFGTSRLLYLCVAHAMAKTVSLRVDSGGQVGLDGLGAWRPQRLQEAIEALNGSVQQNVRMDPRGQGSGLAASEHVVLVSSWLVMTFMGSHGDLTSKSQLRQLTNCVRTALSEALQVCRASVHVTDMSVKGGDDSLVEMLQDGWRPNWHRQHHYFTEEGGGYKLAQMMRRGHAADAFRQMNFTRVKASYEVRVFPEMRVTSKDVVQRIDRLQIFSRFADLNHLLVRSLAHRSAHARPAEGVMLDDIGYGLREVKPRMALPAVELADCMEEGLLSDAREVHQYVIGLCCVLVLLITCAGSAIFSLKQPSLVPSRTNPLLALR